MSTPSQAATREQKTAQLRVTVVEARNIPPVAIGKPDPYVKLCFGVHNARTRHLPSTSKPKWDETLFLPVSGEKALGKPLIVELRDRDLFTPDDHAGRAEVPVFGLNTGITERREIVLEPPQRKWQLPHRASNPAQDTKKSAKGKERVDNTSTEDRTGKGPENKATGSGEPVIVVLDITAENCGVDPAQLRQLGRAVKQDRIRVQQLEQQHRAALTEAFWEGVPDLAVHRPELEGRDIVILQEWMERNGLALAAVLQRHKIERIKLQRREEEERRLARRHQAAEYTTEFWKLLLILSEIDYRFILFDEEELSWTEILVERAKDIVRVDVLEAEREVRDRLILHEEKSRALFLKSHFGGKFKLAPSEEHRFRRAIEAEEELAWLSIFSSAQESFHSARWMQEQRQGQEQAMLEERQAAEMQEQDARQEHLREEERDWAALVDFERDELTEIEKLLFWRRKCTEEISAVELEESVVREGIASELLAELARLCASLSTYAADLFRNENEISTLLLEADTKCSDLFGTESGEYFYIVSAHIVAVEHDGRSFLSRTQTSTAEELARPLVWRARDLQYARLWANAHEPVLRQRVQDLEDDERTLLEEVAAELARRWAEHLALCRAESALYSDLRGEENAAFKAIYEQEHQERRALAEYLNQMAKNQQQQQLFQTAETRVRGELAQALLYLHSLLAGFAKQELRFFAAEETERQRRDQDQAAALQVLATREEQQRQRIALLFTHRKQRSLLEESETTARREWQATENYERELFANHESREREMVATVIVAEREARSRVMLEERQIRRTETDSERRHHWKVCTAASQREERFSMVEREEANRRPLLVAEAVAFKELASREHLSHEAVTSTALVQILRQIDREILTLVRTESEKREALQLSESGESQLLLDALSRRVFTITREQQQLMSGERTCREDVETAEAAEASGLQLLFLELHQRLWLQRAQEAGAWQLRCIQERLRHRHEQHRMAVQQMQQAEQRDREAITHYWHGEAETIAANFRDHFMAFQFGILRLVAVELQERRAIVHEREAGVQQLVKAAQRAMQLRLALALERCQQGESSARERISESYSDTTSDIAREMAEERPLELAIAAFCILPAGNGHPRDGPAGRWQQKYLAPGIVRFSLFTSSFDRFERAVAAALGDGVQVLVKPPCRPRLKNVLSAGLLTTMPLLPPLARSNTSLTFVECYCFLGQ
eukprot:TRINITY_DN7777_c0_g1_i1.p1 TRINITY_DN7777_c0_g1~~TRINITY_DN7777_c0_g1_i1.p1  ORF type:complete len:1217 (+),score=227.24 TRINITY_DN7777_c0_g1_i1:38-3652(+)